MDQIAQTPQQKVSGPATFLLLTGIIGMATSVASTLVNVFGAGAGMIQSLAKQGDDTASAAVGGITMIMYVVLGILAFILSLIVVLGSAKMKKMESRGFAMAAAIIAMIPCSGCCVLGLPAGIWALVVLSAEDVKGAYTS